MKLYRYRDWIEWPEADVREYAKEIAAAARLKSDEAAHLEKRMAEEAGYWEPFHVPEAEYGPRKIGDLAEEFIRLKGGDDETIFKQNRRANRPCRDRNYVEKISYATKGDGLTKRRWVVTEKGSPHTWRMLREARRNFARKPFSSMGQKLRRVVERAYWAAEWYPIDYWRWLPSGLHEEPYEGYVWYTKALETAFENALSQARLKQTEAAMWHAFRFGQLLTDLEIRLAHGDLYDKSVATREAQRDGAKAGANARRLAADEERIAAVKSKMREKPGLSANRAFTFVARDLPHLGSAASIERAWKRRGKLGQP